MQSGTGAAPASRPAARTGRSTWRTAASPGGLIGLLGLFICTAVSLFILWRVLPNQDSPGLQAVLVVAVAVTGALGVILAYLLYGYFTMGYGLDRQALTVRWGRSRYTIPLAAIEYVGPATQVLEGQRPGTTLPWPGYYLEVYPVFDGMTVRTFATQPLHRQVMICTTDTLYALSPERPIRFMEELVRFRERVASGAGTADDGAGAATAASGGRPRSAPMPMIDSTQQLPVVSREVIAQRTTVRPTANSTPVEASPAAGRRLSAPPDLLADRAIQLLLGLALVVVMSMVVFIFIKLPSLPDRIPLHFNSLRQVDRIGQPGEILWLPGLTIVVIIANTLLALSVQRYDTFAARMLLIGPLVTGLVAWVAVYNLL